MVATQSDDEHEAKRARLSEVEVAGDAVAEPAEEEMPDADASDEFAGVRVQQLMKLYYGQLFPFEEFHKWLAYGNDSKHPQADAGFFRRRELCFTLDGDIFVRYQSFQDAADLRKEIIARVPAKLDIGPVYSVDPRRRAAFAGASQAATSDHVFVPLERELVFDIDLTDYDDVRTCGQGGHICARCWPLMALAVQVLDRGLREDFGFRHLLWVFSGRRGVHCWVCDRRARALTDEQRSAVAHYFSVYRGREKGAARLAVPPHGACHPAVERAAAAIRDAWPERLLPQQRLLEARETWQPILLGLGDEELAGRLDARWGAQGAPLDGADVNARRWGELQAEVAKVAKGRDARRAAAVQKGLKEVLLGCAYPRLDVEVSKKMNHLLKAPFCVHPKTGKVCVPFDPADVWQFDPEAVPTVQQLLRELGLGPHSTRPAAAAPRWEQTSLAPCLHLFSRAFLQPLAAESAAALGEKARAAAAAPSMAW